MAEDMNNKDDMFNAESLLSLLDEIQTGEKGLMSDLDEVKSDYYPGMIKIAASALSGDDEDDEWASDIIDDITKLSSRGTPLKPVVSYNIDDYDPKIYSDQQLKEIEIGIKHRLHVEEYADPLLSGRQMREIRYGLERNLDIKFYNNKYFRERQMKEIRLGLQDNLDVESYARLMYAATDMRKKRLELFHQKYDEKMDTISYDYDDEDTGIHIYVEPGLMEAGIVIKDRLPEKFTREDLKKLLASYDITEGFREAMIPQNLSNLPKGVKIPIMFGKEAVPGKDGYFEYLFSVEEGNKPKINENGTVDYTPTREFKAVKRGEVIVKFHSAMIGENGKTVTGIDVKGTYGQDPEPLKSDDLIISRDKTYYMSKKDGFVSLSNGQVRIMDNLMFNEDITYNNGKITFDGTVQIRGSVRERAEIYATGDIIVSGYVESAIFVAGGDIIITGGINADEGGSYVAKGNITAGFFENATVSAGGNIETGYILNSNISAEGYVKTKGKKSLICGGTVIGREGVFAGTIGSSAGTKTNIEVGNEDSDSEEYMKLISVRKSVEAEIKKIENVMGVMVQKMGAVDVRQDDSYNKLEAALNSKNSTLEKINSSISAIDAKRVARNFVRVEASREVFENVLININGNKIVTKEKCERAVFKIQGRTVVINKPE